MEILNKLKERNNAKQQAANSTSSNSTSSNNTSPAASYFPKIEGASIFTDQCVAELNSRTQKIYKQPEEMTALQRVNMRQPSIIALAKCQQKEVELKLGTSSYVLLKEDFGILVILLDFVIVIVFLLYILIIDQKQQEFIDEFKDQTIEMDDFAVEFDAIPNNKFFNNNLHVLRAYLW